MPPTLEPQAVLAEQVRRARRRAGLSGRELAALGGFSQATVSALERGRDVGHATLQSLIDVLPGLDPRPILGRPAVGARPASLRLWRFFADLLGFRARTVALRVRLDGQGGQRSELEVTGLRWDQGGTGERARCVALMGVALVGSSEAAFGLRRISELPPDGSLSLEDGDLLHVFDVPRDVDRKGLRYRRLERGPVVPAGSPIPGQAPHGLPFERGACLWLDYPSERLDLRVEFEGDERPSAVRPEAWPASVGVDPDNPANQWSELFPHAPRWIGVSAKGVVELRIDRPLAGPCYGLSWGPAPPQADLARSPATASAGRAPALASVLESARTRAGFSARALARRLAISPATLLALEDGAEPRVSTLRAYADALPELSPFELFTPREPKGRATPKDVWEHQRDFFGMEAKEELTLIRIARNGDMKGELTTEGLSWTRAAARDLRLRHGLTRVPGGSTWELDSISTEDDDSHDARVKVLRRGIGPVVHELRFQGEAERGRVSFTRKITGHGQFVLTRARARRRERPARTWEAIYAEPSLPTRQLSFELRFPRGHWPPTLTARVVPRCLPLADSAQDLRPGCHSTGFTFRTEPEAGRARLTVKRPLIGLRYVFTWTLS
jgi:transcriptional regulator with XRE-family HTH domain